MQNHGNQKRRQRPSQGSKSPQLTALVELSSAYLNHLILRYLQLRSSHNIRIAEHSSDIVSVTNKSPMSPPIEADALHDFDSGSETPSSPTFSDHNSNNIDKIDKIESVPPVMPLESEGTNLNNDVPDDAKSNHHSLQTILDHNINGNNGLIKGDESLPPTENWS